MNTPEYYPLSARKRTESLRIIGIIFLVALVGAGVMYMFTYIIPLSGNSWFYVLCTFIIIALGLAVPYWMLKLGFHYAHTKNREEKELHLADLSKDQQELKKEPPRT